jgi:FkbM family methyltransferase
MCNGEVIGRFFGIIDLIYSNGEFLLRMPDGILLTIDSYSFNPLIIAETWLYDIHFLGFDLSDWFVLDIGAFVGDTALYYARRGAFVVAVEPLPSYYEAMLRNLELNPELKSRIISINAAISSEDGFVKFRTTIDGSESIYGTDRFVTRTRSIKLSTLINELGSRGIDISKFRVRVLKADCKGCEYELMNDGSLRLFDIAKIEYSGYLINKTYHELMSKLEELGFRCRVWAHNEFAIKIGLDKHGTMTCIKKNEMIIR